jgi:hypothetical protein
MAVTVGEINARLLRQRFQLLCTILGQQQPVDKQLKVQFIEIYFFPYLCANVYVQQIR